MQRGSRGLRSGVGSVSDFSPFGSRIEELKSQLYNDMKKYQFHNIEQLCLNPVFSALFISFFEKQLMNENEGDFQVIKGHLRAVQDIQFDFCESIEEARKMNGSFLSIQEFEVNERESRKSTKTVNPSHKKVLEDLEKYLKNELGLIIYVFIDF